MIFKISPTTITSIANIGRKDLYISICTDLLYGNASKCKVFIHKKMNELKILNIDINNFYYEIRSFDFPVNIRCGIIINGKRKSFCSLEQLIPYQSANMHKYATPTIKMSNNNYFSVSGFGSATSPTTNVTINYATTINNQANTYISQRLVSEYDRFFDDRGNGHQDPNNNNE